MRRLVSDGGFRVGNSRLRNDAGDPVLLIKRFDRAIERDPQAPDIAKAGTHMHITDGCQGRTSSFETNLTLPVSILHAGW